MENRKLECEEFRRGSEAKCCLCARSYKARGSFIPRCPTKLLLTLLQARTLICPVSQEQSWGRVPTQTTPCWDQLFSPSFAFSLGKWHLLGILQRSSDNSPGSFCTTRLSTVAPAHHQARSIPAADVLQQLLLPTFKLVISRARSQEPKAGAVAAGSHFLMSTRELCRN